ncbi:3-(methylthio)propionyl-CoA ligase [Acidovorax sp. DW039]|uniref:3-(methylthio)propionyl-CoA ligase n=1 Tax=Acidovorax sp. DW039 TaxID=3095606 RepID=UPI0030CAF72D
MYGLMQEQALLISSLIKSAERYHGDVEVVSRRVEGDLHRYTWRDVAARSRHVANSLGALRLAPSARVATIAWNGYRHLELYYGVSGSGRVLHTINPRLHAQQILWILNHAEDEVVCFDATFLPLVQQIHFQCRVRHWIMLCDPGHLPADTGIPGLVGYEDWIAAASDEYEWPDLDEKTASSMCYTSGTTGDPKAALYSHRSTILHAYALALPDSLALSSRDVLLPVVPMFHVNAWGIPYGAAMVGAKLVLPGPNLDGRSVYELIEGEGVTLALGVPTVWQMLLNHADANDLRFTSLRRTVIGGAACPMAMLTRFQNHYGVEVLHCWGMTETSPLGTVSSLRGLHVRQPLEVQNKVRMKQGRPVFGIDLRIIDGERKELPWDGKSAGDLEVRGPWVIQQYYKDDRGIGRLNDGWFPTGDVATIDQYGYMQITDRSKDVVKSGGEWLSTIDIENIAMSHPDVAMAAAIGVKHPKWDERPILVVVKKPDAQVTREELLAFYEGKLSKWQCPDDVVFVSEIPLGATGKMLKASLRSQFIDYVLPSLRKA